MTHQWHDSYRHERTPAHHLDPRSKLFVSLLFVGFVLLTPQFSALQIFGYSSFLIAAVVFSGISFRPLLARFLVVLPFAFLMSLSAWFSHMPFERVLVVLGKAFFSIAAMSLLMLTTPFPDMLRALEQLRLPSILILFLAFLYRYGDVLSQEAVQLERAWTSRYFGRFWWKQWIHLGHILASLFVRSYERAERVFAAMQARGFSSETATMGLLHFGAWDVFFVATSALWLSGLRWGHF
jgi:cobalt/nickel transport system permease protein